jgi:hypothetical protein
MPMWLRAAGVGSSLIVLIALMIAFFKQIITFIAFLTGAIKILIVLVFVALIIGIGYMVLKGWNESRKAKG